MLNNFFAIYYFLWSLNHEHGLKLTCLTFCLFQTSGNAVLGIPYALASLSFCQSFNLDLLKASATLTLADLWFSLGSNHAKRALALLHGVFPLILGHGGLELCARAYILEAKCYLADASFLGTFVCLSSLLLHICLLESRECNISRHTDYDGNYLLQLKYQILMRHHCLVLVCLRV